MNDATSPPRPSEESLNGTLQPNTDEIARFLRLVVPKGAVVEIRAFDAIELIPNKEAKDRNGNLYPFTVYTAKTKELKYQRRGATAGYFLNMDAAAFAAGSLNYFGRTSVFCTLQEIPSDLLARSKDRLEFRGKATEDSDVSAYRLFAIDIDTPHPKGCMATEEERAVAQEMCNRVREYLRDLGFPEPVVLDSGNGRWLIYALDRLLVSERALYESALGAVSQIFPTAARTVDTEVGNPSRLFPIAGTIKRKGDHCPEVGRPWRMVRLLEVPEGYGERKVTQDLLVALSRSAPMEEPQPQQQPSPSTHPAGPDRWHRWMEERGVPVLHRNSKSYGVVYVLAECLTGGAAHCGKAHVTVFHGGAVIARCLHADCKWTWRDLRMRYEPDAYQGRASLNGSSGPRTEQTSAAEPNDDPGDNRAGDSDWPKDLASEAFYGLAGQFVRVLSPHTESDPAGLLLSFHTCVGNAIGDGPYFLAENDKHPPRLFVCLVGDTSKGRKGTSRGRILNLFEGVDLQWVQQNVKSGLSSGEGLIFHVRDPIEREEPVREKKKIVGYETVVVDRGVSDKRMLVLEDEFASALKVLRREGNTLSPTLRRAWDSGNLHILTKNNPIRATGAHVSLLGHITRQELLRHLTETEYANGFGNRFLWILVRRAQVLPFGGNLMDEDIAPIRESVQAAVEFARKQHEIKRDSEANELWQSIYPHLSAAGPGLLGAITARAEAQTMRLALIYALLDRSPVIRLVHLQAGLAVWAYALNSAKCIFGLRTGDPVADKVLEKLQKRPGGLTLTELHQAFSNNLKGNRLSDALRTLEKEGLARQHVITLEDGVELRWFAKV